MPEIQNATRSIPKATYVALPLAPGTQPPSRGAALLKYGYIQHLTLQPGEVDAVHQGLSVFRALENEPSLLLNDHALWDTLRSFEGGPMRSLLPSPSVFANIPAASLLTFGRAIAGLRKQAVDQVLTSSIPGTVPAPGGVTEFRPQALVVDPGNAQHLLNLVAVANKVYDHNINFSRIGMLNLERLEMAPAGIERGELLATIPLAPGEKTAVVQKEWSVTSKEFTSIVTDSLENYSETGVTDNTELSQSTTSQIQHSNQFNITGTVSGGIPIISGSSTSTFNAQDSSSQSATDSRKHAVTLTQKASSRTKQEHKVTISTTTVTGTAETTTRELENPSTTDPIRIDYFSLMRKWVVRLYRYGLRLTYDIVIPEPAGALRKAYAELADLQSQVGPFTFTHPHSEITELELGAKQPHYLSLAEQYGAQVPLHPEPRPDIYLNANAPNTDIHTANIFPMPPLNIPDGYWITHLFVSYHFESHKDVQAKFRVLGSKYPEKQADQGDFGPDDLTTPENGSFLLHASGSLVVSFRLEDTTNVWIGLRAQIAPTDTSISQWVNDVWNALYNAAQTQYYAKQQFLAEQISQLEKQLADVDTLTLRREESDEIMKGILRFLLGPDFNFMPKSVSDAIKKSGGDVQPEYGVAFTGNALGLSQDELTIVRQYEDQVRFINQAIEWENVVSFLYSYFWDIPDSWSFIRQIKHPDANRQAFLRAGAARVVLTVRKGWEDAWVRFAEGGFLDAALPANNPYLPIAQEIAAYDDRNYPGIPPANPGQSAIRLEDAVYTTSKMQLMPKLNSPLTNVEIEVESSTGFLVGAQVVIDSRVEAQYINNAGRQEQTTITAIPDETHIMVAQLQYPHGGDEVPMPFPIVQPGEKGIVIAEWYEYTPTSGTDIAVTSNLSTIA